MSKNRKGFTHYCRVSVNDGFNTDLSTSDLLLENLIKKYFKTVVFGIAQLKLKKLLLKKDVCDYCMALLENEDQINPRIHINWTENQKYSFCKLLLCIFRSHI